MSIHNLGAVLRLSKSKLNNVNLILRNISRRSNTSDGPYKIVKARENPKGKYESPQCIITSEE